MSGEADDPVTIIVEMSSPDALSPEVVTMAYALDGWLTADQQQDVRRAAKKGGCQARVVSVNRAASLDHVLASLRGYSATTTG